MPIVDVEVVLRPEEVLDPGTARALADRLGAILASGPGRTWVRLRSLPAERYAENDSDLEVHPVFVSILRAEGPERDALVDVLPRVTEAVAEACGRPAANVHVVHEAAGRGRVAFGGRLFE